MKHDVQLESGDFVVEKEINKNGGSLGFVDDFNAWVVGEDEEQTTKLAQDTIIPHAEKWAARSSAIFEADKTSLIHFTRKKTPDDSIPLRFDGKEIWPQRGAKILGVTLDEKLRMNEHVTRMANKATYAAIALRGIKGVRPAQMRQLYQSCVLPILDYGASTWDSPKTRGVKEAGQDTRQGSKNGGPEHSQGAENRCTPSTRGGSFSREHPDETREEGHEVGCENLHPLSTSPT